MRFSGGYYYENVFSHPQASNNRGTKYVKRSRLIVEKTLGKYLPKKAVIHHVDGNRSNDSQGNLVVCENDSYHKTIEKRTRAFRACGHANWEKCYFCKEYDDPKNLYICRFRGSAIHRYCLTKKNKDYQKKKKVGFKNNLSC